MDTVALAWGQHRGLHTPFVHDTPQLERVWCLFFLVSWLPTTFQNDLLFEMDLYVVQSDTFSCRRQCDLQLQEARYQEEAGCELHFHWPKLVMKVLRVHCEGQGESARVGIMVYSCIEEVERCFAASVIADEGQNKEYVPTVMGC